MGVVTSPGSRSEPIIDDGTRLAGWLGGVSCLSSGIRGPPDRVRSRHVRAGSLRASDDLPFCHDVIRAAPFAPIATRGADGELIVSHLPFLLDADRGPLGTLIAHVARANEHGERRWSARPRWSCSPGPTPTSRRPGTRPIRPFRRGTTWPSTRTSPPGCWTSPRPGRYLRRLAQPLRGGRTRPGGSRRSPG